MTENDARSVGRLAGSCRANDCSIPLSLSICLLGGTAGVYFPGDLSVSVFLHLSFWFSFVCSSGDFSDQLPNNDLGSK